MDDDFNTPKAFAELFLFVTKTNRYFKTNPHPEPTVCAQALQNLIEIGHVLTLFQTKAHRIKDSTNLNSLKTLAKKFNIEPSNMNIEDLLQHLLARRENARKEKDWKTSDNIRASLDELGFEIQDTNEGPVWRKK